MMSVLNVELTSRCQKHCWMCGRRKMEREHPELCDWGDMHIQMVEMIAGETPPGTFVQLHNNGEPLLYPCLKDALSAFSHCIRQFNTNGKLLMEQADTIIGNMEVLTISVIQDDPEGDEQYETVKAFLGYKGHNRPSMVYRLLGNVDNHARWASLPGRIARRILHSPDGSRDYERPVTIPEGGVCLDLLGHMAINREGDISLCVRFDPEGYLKLGNIDQISLKDAWESAKRQYYIQKHIDQRRDLCPGCDRCHFWGVPRGD